MEPAVSPLATFAIFGFIGLSFLVWSAVLRRTRRGQPAIPFMPRREVPWTGWDVLTIFAVYLLSQVGAVGLMKLLAPPPAGDAIQRDIDELTLLLASNALASIVVLIFAWFWARHRSGATANDVGFSSSGLSKDLGLGVAAFFALSVPIYALQAVLTMWVPPEHPLMSLLQKRPDLLMLLLASFTAAIIAPVFEELIFRVLLQG